MKPFNIEVMLYRINLEKVAGQPNWTLELAGKGPQGQMYEWAETFHNYLTARLRFQELSELLEG
jgi:hypothetical protein